MLFESTAEKQVKIIGLPAITPVAPMEYKWSTVDG